MALRFAFMGFRHFHILPLYELVRKTDGAEVVAACEQDQDARKALPDSVTLTHDRYDRMLDEVDCDVVAVGDYYARRGGIIIEALERGLHAISDKPICTDPGELDRIEKLATQKGLSVSCQLDMVYSPNMRCLRDLVHSGRTGEIHQILIGGQHPLSYGTRPIWYFEPGKHGGTINDIAIHAVHMLPWMTGLRLSSVVAARTWNAFATAAPHFHDAAQCMLSLSNGCGVLMDVSYATPSSSGYTLAQYWRCTLFGTGGVAETSENMDHVTFAEEGSKQAEVIRPERTGHGDYLQSLMREIAGEPADESMSTADIIAASRTCLRIQQAADRSERDVALEE